MGAPFLLPAPRAAKDLASSMDKMALLLEHLTQAQQHVAEGAVHIAEQQQRITELPEGGHDTTQAEALLKTFLETQRTHEEGLATLRAEIVSTSLGSTRVCFGTRVERLEA